MDTQREIKGQIQFVVEWNKTRWLFASQEPADTFKNDPGKYEPQYNGVYCNALAGVKCLTRTDCSVWEFSGGQPHSFYVERSRLCRLKSDWKSCKAIADKVRQNCGEKDRITRDG